MPAVVLDNGAHEIKAGFADQQCVSIYNALTRARDRRFYIGNDINQCRDVSGLVFRRPIEKGQLYSWEAEKVIWDYMFDSTMLGSKVDPQDSTLILTEAPYTLGTLSVNTDQIVLEEYEFDSYRRCTPQSLAPWTDLPSLFNDPQVGEIRDCALIVDSGFTATQVVPVKKGKTCWKAVRRLDIGGKLLTNYLKEIVSFRYYNMMEEPYILNAVKERLCYVSKDFPRDLRACRENPSAYSLSYVLPDALTPDNRLGKVIRDPAEANRLRKSGDYQVLTLRNERFSVPEVLYSPTDVGLDQAGLPETIAQSIAAAPEETQSLMWSNIVVAGGTAKFENFIPRLEQELLPLCPQGVPLRVRLAENPIEYAWEGGSKLARSPQLDRWTITRQDYLENGESVCIRMFGKNPYD